MPYIGPKGSRRGPRRTAPLVTMGAFIVTGITRDSTGAILGGCTVKRYRSNDDYELASTVSDTVTGVYTFQVPQDSQPYYLVAYKAGSLDVAGTTVNTLTGA